MGSIFYRGKKYSKDLEPRVEQNENNIAILNGTESTSGSVRNVIKNNVLGDVSTEYNTLEKIENIIQGLNSLEKRVVEELPTVEDAEDNVLYMIEAEDSEETDVYNLYTKVGNELVFLGNTQTDLSNYYNKEEIDSMGVGKKDPNSPNSTGEYFNSYEDVESGGTIVSHRNAASGRYAHAEGSETAASGDYSHAEGQNTTSSGNYSHAEGNRVTSSGYGAHAEGGRTTASGYASHAEGVGTQAQGDLSHSEGYQTQAKTMYAHVEGQQTVAEDQGINVGSSPRTQVLPAHAEGYNTKALNGGTHAEGMDTKATGLGAHAEGTCTEAKGEASHASGAHTIAGHTQVAIGMYNVEDTGSWKPYESHPGAFNEYAFIIGNGYARDQNAGLPETRSNALAIDWEGNISVSDNNGDLRKIPLWELVDRLAALDNGSDYKV